MNKKRIFQMIVLGVKQMRDPYYQGFAAQVGFYFLMSIVPTLIVLSQLLGFFSISLDALSVLIQKYVASDAADIVLKLISSQSTSGMNIAFIGITLWAASRAEFALMRIANYTLTGGRSTGKGYWRERIRAIKTMIVTLFTLAFGLVILVYGELILKIVAAALMRNIGLNYEVDLFWLVIRWPITMALYFLMVSYTYYILPSHRLKFRQIMPGSIFASVGMLVVTSVYKIYTEYISNYDILYGSMAALVAVMMWFYFLAWALVLGILCNKVWADTTIPH
ncbi:YihY/virulence factor BrkB family protein [Aminipila luticellarii]|uniref:YihY/virulence factor BrkB family protein n=1 Tax=Aminipila luticellarii TaxID=2507160 RepID=A0A410PSP2_9FIRM|nr:YihY/virulence factor BrkB family protein [Aminipila luticellarii]QAT41982.1 YihY/virulence factor BrkB family protein [Aminipila luticellarii]